MNDAACPSPVDITGKTRVLGIIAHPTDHVKAPPRINAIARARGKDAVMVPFSAPPSKLGCLVDALRALQSFDGAIVTVPHKQAILPHCDEISPRARAAGAVNIIRRLADGRLKGDQLDGLGFVTGLARAGISVRGKAVHLTGAGGAARAIAAALAASDVGKLTLANRSVEKIAALRADLLKIEPLCDIGLDGRDTGGHDIVINATTLGMKADDPLPLDTASLAPSMVVAEVVMQPEITPLLAAARSTGCVIHLGRHMLESQIELMADFLGL